MHYDPAESRREFSLRGKKRIDIRGEWMSEGQEEVGEKEEEDEERKK